MPAPLASVEIVVGVLVAVAVLLLAGVFVRRRVLARGRLLTLCGLRPLGGDRWRLGLARLGSSQLEWFPLVGVSFRPHRSWERVGLDLEAPVTMEGTERIDLLVDAVSVRCYHGDEGFDLAVQPAAYTALRSWWEAAPPGSRANVA